MHSEVNTRPLSYDDRRGTFYLQHFEVSALFTLLDQLKDTVLKTLRNLVAEEASWSSFAETDARPRLYDNPSRWLERWCRFSTYFVRVRCTFKIWTKLRMTLICCLLTLFLLESSYHRCADTFFGGSITREQVASVAVDSCYLAEASNKIVEIVATADARQVSTQQGFESVRWKPENQNIPKCTKS